MKKCYDCGGKIPPQHCLQCQGECKKVPSSTSQRSGVSDRERQALFERAKAEKMKQAIKIEKMEMELTKEILNGNQFLNFLKELTLIWLQRLRP